VQVPNDGPGDKDQAMMNNATIGQGIVDQGRPKQSEFSNVKFDSISRKVIYVEQFFVAKLINCLVLHSGHSTSIV